MARWYAPLDPDCPEVEEFSTTLFDDPMTQHTGMGGEVMEGWEYKHKAECERCQRYGVENIDIAYN